ncbi:alginate export family protein [Roseomonas sp. AR75]|uniref:alginate export family protein n=1 Tax=Roseomonas sp. AR75 TaxID=2562311 RepID=UPI0010BFE1BD|nr:alginate export family protein [Roseomonas sp. AR75]
MVERMAGGVGRALAACRIAALGVLLGAPPGAALAQGAPEPTVLWEREGLRVTGSVEGIASGQAHRGAWNGLAARYGPPGLSDRANWGEFVLAPGLDATWQAAPELALYGGVSLLAAGTLGLDVYGSGDRGAVLLERAFIGLRTSHPDTWNLDISAGAQPYIVGTGMLIAQGAGNGFSRGAVSLMPRRAFANTAIARVSNGGFSAEAFWLDANEVPSADTATQLAGGLVQYRWDSGTRIGFTGFQAIQSTLPYPLAPAGLVENGREGLVSWHGFGELDGTRLGLPGASVRGEFAVQRNDRIDLAASAWFLEAAYRFASVPWSPRLSYGYASFSGDRPGTARVERFDPLFYGNGLENWFFGASGGYSVLNTNVDVHRVALDLMPSQRDFVKLLYLRSSANQTNSPIQFGQATQVAVQDGNITVTSGVPTAHLLDELYVQWTRLLTPAVALTGWATSGWPGAGLRAIGADQTWQAVGLTLSVRF